MDMGKRWIPTDHGHVRHGRAFLFDFFFLSDFLLQLMNMMSSLAGSVPYNRTQ